MRRTDTPENSLYRSVKLDIDTDLSLRRIADEFYEGNISMAFREAIRRMFRAEFPDEAKTQ